MEIYCEECGALFRNDCHCEPVERETRYAKADRWQGIDGHMYVGDKTRSSLAMHDTENCACPQGANFDPDAWF